MIALAPLVSKQVNVYIDSSQAALGTTLLSREASVDFSMSGVYGPDWFFNRSTPSWTTHVDLQPKTAFKMKVVADADGMAMLGYL